MNKSLDGLKRKRIYLFRHGNVSYFGSGRVTKDPNMVDLTDEGLLQAKLIDKNTKNIRNDINNPDFIIPFYPSFWENASIQYTKTRTDKIEDFIDRIPHRCKNRAIIHFQPVWP